MSVPEPPTIVLLTIALVLFPSNRARRYRAELHEIRQRYAEFEIEGEPMVIHGPAETLSPYRHATGPADPAQFQAEFAEAEFGNGPR